ncbi:MAG: hypothetical protein IPO93_12405 [Actinobacteria bacterium]|jgi:hypothetical protein|nr:hypothetical protein [Actinomycetota bacterium]
MKTTGAHTGIRIAALGAAAALLLASCSSSDEPAASASASLSLPAVASSSAAAVPSTSAVAVPTGAAAVACNAYFELDVLNSQYAGGAVANGNITEAQVRADFQRLLKEMVAQGKVAVADGTLDQKMVTNAKRMKKMIKSLKDAEALSDLSKAQQAKFAKQSLRVQKACDAAGFPLPADNVTARTAAGL